MSEKRQLQKAQTKEKITAAALKMYSENGFSTPTLAIANEAQVSHGSIFVHFPTVEDLLISSLDVFSKEIEKELLLLSDSDNDIATLLEMHIDVLIRHEDFYKRLIKETVYLPEETKNTFIAIQSTVSIHFLQALEKKMSEGKIKNVPFHMIFNTWLGLVHYYLLNSDLFTPKGSVLKQYKNSLIECFLTLIEK
ncbi:MAG: TetR/AcrR family transcriptional regulator [Methanomassiliicoccaceae archaeon]|nr:TetR/AcrR family transcriptional regulator [Methanomassiliicoccaceae archaeon]